MINNNFNIFVTVYLCLFYATAEACWTSFDTRDERIAHLANEANLKVGDLKEGRFRRVIVSKSLVDGKPVYKHKYYDGVRPLKLEEVDSLLQRLSKLKIAIPPSWDNVVIADSSRSHVQVRGIDQSNRAQSLHHPDWNHIRDLHKFDHNINFGHRLTDVRAKAHADIKAWGLSKEKVVATAVLLMDTTFIRVGNEGSRDDFGHYGLTTLLKSHILGYDEEDIILGFVGKGGIEHRAQWSLHKGLAPVLDELFELPGSRLFQWIDDAKGRIQTIKNDDINEYIGTIIGKGFTAKNFRTWAATVLAIEVLSYLPFPETLAQKKANWREAKQSVSQLLNNKPGQAEKSYIDPVVKDVLFSNPKLIYDCHIVPPGRPPRDLVGLNPNERAALRFLESVRI